MQQSLQEALKKEKTIFCLFGPMKIERENETKKEQEKEEIE